LHNLRAVCDEGENLSPAGRKQLHTLRPDVEIHDTDWIRSRAVLGLIDPQAEKERNADS
jgi:hypothetical protein